MTVPHSELPTVDQMRNLIGHAQDRALSYAESERLRAGFEHLVASQAAQRARIDHLSSRLTADERPALDVECATCQAPARAPCTRRYGQPMPGFHRARLTAALADNASST